MWSPDLETFDFGIRHPIKVGRFQMIRDFIEETDFLNQENVLTITPRTLPEKILRRIHSEGYLEKVRRISETGIGEIDIDTPGFKGIYENARITSGATITGIISILEGTVNHIVSPTGGFHHSRYEGGGGFSIFNDIAASVYELKDRGFRRILVADFDVHHGNGTQTYFYDDPGVMKISFHEDPEWMYPHDGFIEDIGEGAGRGYNINMHFPMDTGDASYRYAFDEIVPPLVDFYKPEFILFIPGFDTHYMDPLAHMILTTDMTRYITEQIHKASHRWAKGRLAVVAGGGYHSDSLKWGIGVVMSVISGHPYEPPRQNPPFEDDEETWDSVRLNVKRIKEQVFTTLNID
ncbi:MAG: histone deacetylase family protein [Promethearchaeota archaeon]